MRVEPRREVREDTAASIAVARGVAIDDRARQTTTTTTTMATATATATTAEEFSQIIQAPYSTRPWTTYPVRANPSLL